MTKSQIKAELRRSACEGADPWGETSYVAIAEVIGFSEFDEYAWRLPIADCRTFFLLVAEAL